MQQPSPEAVAQVWTVSLVVYAVVLVVVALLLAAILSTARRIRGGVAEIWNVGQRIANNTIHIALLDRTNHTAGRILAGAGPVAEAAAALRRHAEACPRCPTCATKRGPE